MKNKTAKSNKISAYIKASFALILVCVVVIYGIKVASQNEKREDSKIFTPLTQADLQGLGEVQKLIKILKDNGSNKEYSQKIEETIHKLGSIKAKEAIPELIKYLSYRKTFDLKQKQDPTEITHWDYIPVSGRYPAVGALFQIGTPALPALIKVVEECDVESVESQNALYTIELIFRDDLSEGIKYLENAKYISSSEVGKSRLANALEKTKAKHQMLNDK